MWIYRDKSTHFPNEDVCVVFDTLIVWIMFYSFEHMGKRIHLHSVAQICLHSLGRNDGCHSWFPPTPHISFGASSLPLSVCEHLKKNVGWPTRGGGGDSE